MTDTITITRIGEAGDVTPDPEVFPEEDLLPGGFDAQGNPYRVSAVSFDSPGWYIAGNEGGGESAAPEGESDVMRIVIYNRTVVDVRSSDQVTVRGRVWKIVGDIEPWISPTTTFAGTAVTLGRAG